MSITLLIAAYLATGALAGTMSGLLGIGGGIVVVPALAAIFLNTAHIPAALHMKMAIATSLAIMIVTLASSIFAYHKRGAINWSLVKMMLPGLLAGVVVGAILVKLMPSRYLSILFSVFLVIIGLRLLLKKNEPVTVLFEIKPFSKLFMRCCSFGIGLLSSLLGTGGGTMWVPFFLYCHLTMYNAVGTSVACGMAAAFVGTLSFLLTDFFITESIPWSTSYIYWPAFFGVSAMSVFFSPVGAALAYKVPHELLRRVFAVVVLVVAVDMMFFI